MTLAMRDAAEIVLIQFKVIVVGTVTGCTVEQGELEHKSSIGNRDKPMNLVINWV